MKKIITISLAVMLIMTNLHSQVYHREYYSTPTTLKATSSAFVQLDTANTSLLFKCDGTKIEVIPINTITRAPIPPSAIYAFNYTPTYSIYLENAFLDYSGNVILYGYVVDNVSTRGMMIKYNPSTASSFTFKFMPASNGGKIISGCCGLSTTGDTNYVFVNEKGYLISTNQSFSITAPAIKPHNGQFTDVSYNKYNNTFLVSGRHKSSNGLAAILSSVSLNSFFAINFLYSYPLVSWNHFAQGRTIHKQLNDESVLLCQDLSDGNTDYAWIATMHTNNGRVFDAEIVKFGTKGLSLIDVDYDPNKDRAMILGRLDFCQYNTEGRNFILQEFPSHMHSTSYAQMFFLTSTYDYPCTSGSILDVNNIYLSQLFFNQNNNLFFSSGINKFLPTNIYSIEFRNRNSAINCDEKYEIPRFKHIVEEKTITFTKLEMENEKEFEMNIFTIVDPHCDTICYSDNYIPDENKYTPLIEESLDVQGTTIKIENDNKLVLTGFTGRCQCQLYDLSGKLIDNFIYSNSKTKTLQVKVSGLYILKVQDEQNCVKVEKVLIIR